jgi:hypothetical protein
MRITRPSGDPGNDGYPAEAHQPSWVRRGPP